MIGGLALVSYVDRRTLGPAKRWSQIVPRQTIQKRATQLCKRWAKVQILVWFYRIYLTLRKNNFELYGGYSMLPTGNVDIECLEELIQEILQSFNEPYPDNITDQLFLTIQGNLKYLNRYKQCAGDNTGTANQMIGKLVKKHTKLDSINRSSNPRSHLITSFTRLGKDP